MLLLRSALFNLCFTLSTGLFSTLLILSRPFGFSAAWFWGKCWSASTMWLARIICGIRVVIEGREHLPDTPCVVLAKHQSAFETIAMPQLVPPFVWVLKRELFYIPIFGWALWALNAIAIRRTNPREALRQVIDQGRGFLEHGRWVVIFPEGTRTSPGREGNWQASGVTLAQKAQVGILPLAHNAGTAWPKSSFIKRPGTIIIRFLPLIDAAQVAAMSRNDLLAQVRDQVEANCREIGG